MRATPRIASGYRELFSREGFTALFAGMLVGRTAAQVGRTALVLALIIDYHSPAAAGLATFCSIVPGLILSPIAGALLDRRGRRVLVMLDYIVAALTLVVIAQMFRVHPLPFTWFIAVVVLNGITAPLSSTGLRTLLPILLERPLWDRGNALDSVSFTVANLIGAPIAGVLIAVSGGAAAVLTAAVMFAVAALTTLALRDPIAQPQDTTSLLAEALEGFRYIIRNVTLRWLAMALFWGNFANGAFTVGLPVLALARLHSSASFAGLLFAVMAASTLVSTLVVGAMDTEGRERRFITLGYLSVAAGMGLVIVAPSAALVVVGCLIAGAAGSPVSVAMFSLRQRATDQRKFGRVFALHVSLNFSGFPIGAAIAGPIAAVSPPFAIALAVAAHVTAAAVTQGLPTGRQSRVGRSVLLEQGAA